MYMSVLEFAEGGEIKDETQLLDQYKQERD